MAYEKIHESINFKDRQAPSITADILNLREATFEELDNRTVELSIFNESVPETYATKEEVTESIAELETEAAETYATKNDLSTEKMNLYRNIMGQVAETYATKSEVEEVSETVTEIATEVSKGKADVILANASGESIHLTDTTNNKAVEFALLGNATQNGTPTPDAPIDIEVVGADGSVEVISENEDGTKSSSATVSTPNGLAGINGVCDEKRVYADGTGQYIQRIGKAVFDGSEATWFVSSASNPNGTVYSMNLHDANPKNLNGISNKFTIVPNGNLTSFTKEQMVTRLNSSGVYTIAFVSDKSTLEEFKSWLSSNNVEYYYVLAEPIITDLSAEEIAELEVRTFYPTTNILNDAGCGMEVTYKADTKNYIDRIIGERISAIETALINNI